MSDYGTSDISTTPLGANQFPISDVYVPNVGLTATEGGPVFTDAGGKKSSPTSMYIKDGSNVTQGAQADAAYTDGTGAASGTGMGLFKGIFVKLAAIATAIVGTLKVKGDFTEVAGQGTGVVNAANTDFLPATDISAYKWFSVTIAGTWSATLTFQVSNDATFTTSQTLVVQKSDAQVANFLSVSANGTYGQTLGWRYMRVRATAFTSNASLAGIFEFYTTPPSPQVMGVTQLGTWTVQPGNTANTTPWLVTANAPTSGTATLANVGGSVSSVALQASNANRKGWYCSNDSTSALYINFGATASATAFTVKVPGGGFFEMPTSPIYTGALNGIWDTATGSARVTELT